MLVGMNLPEDQFVPTRAATTTPLPMNETPLLRSFRESNAEMRTNRRTFLARAGVGFGALGILNPDAPAAEPAKPPPSFAQPSKFHLGTVTYNLAQDWDVPTIIKNCAEAKFAGVELRTGHKHGVEVTISKEHRIFDKIRGQTPS